MKIVKWFKLVVKWLKNLFKKKEYENHTSGTTVTPHVPSDEELVARKMVDTLTSWEDTKLFREYVRENNIIASETIYEFEYNNTPFEEALKIVAGDLLNALNKSEEAFQGLRRREIETWALYSKTV